jgi:hypothetical protein
LRDVSGFAGAKCSGAEAVIVRVGNFEIDDRHTGLEHGQGITQRLRRPRVEEIGESGVIELVGNDIAVQIQDRAAGRDYRLNVDVAEQSLETGVSIGFIRQRVVERKTIVAMRAADGAMDRDAEKIRIGLLPSCRIG